ncbi:gamma-glutamylcyclotransferase family protein [Mangrovicoccus algicola]|uniref:Gamma-glutamylcyclotransferase n=1 Tax=Mangrovicoccus algicola TaxID=2771008 RepID=A0A8J6YS86_9RHOB|nr:gamma-glutamylcyclotransferase family protein [Mangrovicoccus algicola]MBE3636722.1 gamma-glutamylcyclotransferase [Mangrovicoccus algicola]
MTTPPASATALPGWVFGYGSLVNHLTHDSRPLRPARLRGWRREWCLTALRPVAFLSVRPDPGGRIDGLAAEVHPDAWPALDLREHAYDRHAAELETALPGQAAVYAVAPRHRAAGPGGAILLSYLDVVAEGYDHHFGAAGLDAFFATTDGWDRPVADDRAAPLYPRHRDVAAGLRDRVDAHLDRLGLSPCSAEITLAKAAGQF